MASKGHVSALKKDLPILFVYIGWAHHYDGRESIKGNFAYLKGHPHDNTECCAFIPGDDGLFSCGIGAGKLREKEVHIVFVARDPLDKEMKVVGIYAQARVEQTEEWPRGLTKYAILIPAPRRPIVQGWRGQGMRRWALRGASKGNVQRPLHAVFARLLKYISNNAAKISVENNEIDEDRAATEGVRRKYLIAHRTRESKLRRAKILAALKQNKGRLVCEVPGCEFDFFKKYGELGYGYAHVHHLRPLGKAAVRGRKNTPRQLAIVCANCHAMIHRHGACRRLKGLVDKA